MYTHTMNVSSDVCIYNDEYTSITYASFATHITCIYFGILFSTPECGSYAQLDYWANNFDDFAVCFHIYIIIY